MIELLEGIRPGESSVLDEAMRLRHHVFVEEMGWEGLRRADGRDVDQFDTPATIHQIAIVNGEVAGYQRFNATTGPHLLADVHYGLCDGPSPRGNHIWEWSRYCVARKFKREGAFCDVASTLLIAALEWGEPNGVEEFVLEFHPVWITRFLEHDGDPTVAVRLGYGKKTYQRMLEMRGIQSPVLNVNCHAAVRVA
jgi:acyl-homoserine lactone synthase